LLGSIDGLYLIKITCGYNQLRTALYKSAELSRIMKNRLFTLSRSRRVRRSGRKGAGADPGRSTGVGNTRSGKTGSQAARSRRSPWMRKLRWVGKR
jgi:hypothetical protein